MKNMASAIKQTLLSGICRKLNPLMTVFGHMILYCAQNCLVGSYKQNVEAIELAQSKTYSMGMPVPTPYHYMVDLLMDCIVLGCAFMPSSSIHVLDWYPDTFQLLIINYTLMIF